jgi:hypothetical protein
MIGLNITDEITIFTKDTSVGEFVVDPLWINTNTIVANKSIIN